MQLCRAGKGRVSRAADNSSEGRLAALPALLPSAALRQGKVAEEVLGDPRGELGTGEMLLPLFLSLYSLACQIEFAILSG